MPVSVTITLCLDRSPPPRTTSPPHPPQGPSISCPPSLIPGHKHRCTSSICVILTTLLCFGSAVVKRSRCRSGQDHRVAPQPLQKTEEGPWLRWWSPRPANERSVVRVQLRLGKKSVVVYLSMEYSVWVNVRHLPTVKNFG